MDFYHSVPALASVALAGVSYLAGYRLGRRTEREHHREPEPQRDGGVRIDGPAEVVPLTVGECPPIGGTITVSEANGVHVDSPTADAPALRRLTLECEDCGAAFDASVPSGHTIVVRLCEPCWRRVMGARSPFAVRFTE